MPAKKDKSSKNVEKIDVVSKNKNVATLAEAAGVSKRKYSKKNPQSEVIAKSPETIDAQENVPQKSPENTARNNLIFLIENLKITAKRQNARSPEDLAEVIVKVFDHCFDIVLNNDEEECENCKKLEKKHLEKMELLKSEIIDVLDGCENN